MEAFKPSGMGRTVFPPRGNPRLVAGDERVQATVHQFNKLMHCSV